MDAEGHFLLINQIMTPQKLEKLKNDRATIYSNIANGVVTEDELSNQIKHELRLLRSCRFITQLQQINLDVSTDILINFANRINDMYTIFFNSFEFDELKISHYIQFGQQNANLTTKCIDVLDELMSKYHANPEVYIRSAHYAFTECDNITVTRRILSNAFKFHATFQKLYLEEFWIEVQCMDSVGGSLALEKYNNYIQLFNDDMNFHSSLVDKILKFTTVTELHCKVVSDMVNKYRHSALMWQTLAKVNLKGFIYNHESKNIYYSQDNLQCISNCFSTYEKVLEENILDVEQREHLWDFFLNEAMEIKKTPRVINSIINDFLMNKIQFIFDQAFTEKTIKKAEYFIFWANQSKDNELQVLKKSIEVLPENIKLWKAMIMYFAFLDSFKDIMDLLNDALEKLKSDSMPLWTMAEMYILNLDDSYVEEFFQRAIVAEPCNDISLYFRSKYLEWRTLRFGIKSGRTVFSKLRRLEPKSLELFLQMISYETDYNTVEPNDINIIRRLYSRACSEFGRDYTGIWVQCMRFEHSKKFPQLAEAVYHISRDFLEPSLYEALGIIKRKLEIEYSDEIIVIEDDD